MPREKSRLERWYDRHITDRFFVLWIAIRSLWDTPLRYGLLQVHWLLDRGAIRSPNGWEITLIYADGEPICGSAKTFTPATTASATWTVMPR